LAHIREMRLKTIGKLFSSSVDPIIVFSDTEERFDVNNVTAVGTFAKIVVK